MSTNNPEWASWDSQHIWHPYTQMQISPDAHGVVRGEGSYIYLSNGMKVFDAISSWWLTLHGHCNPVIASAIAEQAATLDHVIFAGFTHEPAATLAKKLIGRAPANLEKVFFSDDGSTAVEVALKMCMQYWLHNGERKTTFLAIEGAYHGDTFGAMSASARGIFTAPFGANLFSVIHLPFPTPPSSDVVAYSNEEVMFLDQLRSCCRDDRSIAAFIYEPLLLGAGGMKTWRPKVLGEALRSCKEFGMLTIADEVLTGFGRTGTFFASDQTQMSPDIMTLSKGITGGSLPMGVTLASSEIYAAFLSDDRGKTFFHGHSYTGNPISCAAGVVSLSIFENEPVDIRIATINRVHNQCMPELAARYGMNFRILGTMAAMEPRDPKGYLGGEGISLAKKCLGNGLLIRPLGDVIYFLPPYSSTVDDLTRAYEILSLCLG